MINTLQSSYRILGIRSLSLTRTMSDHLGRTSESFRQPGISEAEVVSIKEASDTVRLLTLRVTDPAFTFKAGQWVDFFIPGVEIFTGYSMCSHPAHLVTHNTLNLAVQSSDYPPTEWVHKQCAVGSKVHIRVGGDKLIYDPQPGDPSWNILLIAGGIGINPLVSMLHHLSHLHTEGKANPQAYTPGRAELLYSSSSKSELIFKDEIEKMVSEHSPNISAKFFVTKASKDEPHLIGRRVTGSDLKEALDRLQSGSSSPLRCFICGPPPMIADIETLLRQQGVRDEDVFCEKWW